MSSLRNDDVGVAFARLDELKVHRLHCLRITLDDPFHGLASLYDVSCHYAHESVVIVCVDEYLDVQQLAELRIREYQDSLDDDDICRGDPDRLMLGASAGDVGIDRLFDDASFPEFLELGSEKVEVDRIGVVEIMDSLLLLAEVAEVLVV